MAQTTVKYWLDNAKPGDRVCYHVGFLDSDAADNPMSNLRRMQRHFLALAHQGLVDLVQEKVDAGLYRYWAIRRRAPHKPAVAWYRIYDPTDTLMAAVMGEKLREAIADTLRLPDLRKYEVA